MSQDTPHLNVLKIAKHTRPCLRLTAREGGCGQGSTTCAILPSWMGEHGERGEHVEHGKHQPSTLRLQCRPSKRIMIYFLGEHDSGSAQDGRTSSEM